MATLSELAVSNLALKGAGEVYNYINRFFATKAEADAALADGSWAPLAGKLNACLTGDQGLLVYNEGTSSLDLADTATRAYIDSQISALVDGAPGTLDTLNELAAALNDNPNYFTDAEAARQANTNLINAESARALTAEQAIQADVDQNEADADAAIAAVQADVDQNESDADAADAALDARLLVLEADPTTAAAVAAVQADVDQNEADADTAIAAVQADVDANEADRKTYFKWESNLTKVVNPLRSSEIEVGNNIHIDPAAGYATQFDGNVEFDNNTTLSHGGTALTATFAELNYVDGVTSNVQTQLDAIQADVDGNEADADAALALKAPLDSPVLTGTPQAPTATAGTSTTQLATTAYVQTAVANLVDNAPGTLDTLNEIATALGNDANLSTTLTNSITAVQADVDQNELDSDTADAALGVRIDNVETEIDTARTNIYAALGRTEGVQAMGTFTGSLLGDNQTVKDLLQTLETKAESLESLKANLSGATFTGDILFGSLARLRESGNEFKIQNDAQSSSIVLGPKISLQPATGSRIELFETVRMPDGTDLTVTGAELNYVDGVTSNIQTQLNAIQDDVDQNESDADTAIAAVQADVDQNESDADAAIAAVQADVDQNESDSDAADAAIVDGTTNFTGFQLAGTAVTATGAELNYLDITSAGTADASKALVVDGTKSISGINTLTVQNLNVQGTTTTVDTVTMQAANAIQFEGLTADANETVLSIVDPTADQTIYLPNQSGYVPVLAAASTTQITATPEELNYVDGVTSNIQTQLNAIQADVDQNESDADTAIALKLDASAVSAFGLTLVDDADAATARTTLGVDAAGTDNSTDVTIAAGRDYVTLSGQELTLGAVDLTTDVTGTLPVANGGTGATDVAGAQAALSVDHLITLSGVAEGSDNFGTFTGSTIGDNLALKAILQAVETAVEARLATTGVTTLLSEYANDGAAETGGVPVGGLYYDGNGHVRVRLV
jgi:hypothetical protein